MLLTNRVMQVKAADNKPVPEHMDLPETTVTPKALTSPEFDALKAWIDENKAVWPEPIQALLGRLIALYQKLANDKSNASDVLKTLRMAMGIVPTSERGKQLLEKC